jgi:hypothetical protein
VGSLSSTDKTPEEGPGVPCPTVPLTDIVWLVVKEVPFIEAVRRPSVFVVVFVMKGVVLVVRF